MYDVCIAKLLTNHFKLNGATNYSFRLNQIFGIFINNDSELGINVEINY